MKEHLFDFDEVLDRKDSFSIKLDYGKRYGAPDDVIPLWVADMDFKSPPCVNERIAERSRSGLYGYSDATDEYFESVRSWLDRRYGYKTDICNIVTSPGVVFSLYNTISALTNPGDSVMIQRPVYYPFGGAIRDLDRMLINNPLVEKDGRYEIDFDDFEHQISLKRVKLFIFSSPHNPVGRVWSREELARIAEICIRHHVYVFSDEIHADFMFEGHRHTVLASISPEIENLTITATSPGKTFNLAGLQIANLVITNEELRRRYEAESRRTGYSQPNVMGLIACKAAYDEGEPWLEALLRYLTENLNYVRERLAADFPMARFIEPDGTYLLWVDFSAYEQDDRVLGRKFLHDAGVWLDHGTMFGPEGEGYQRINIACPRAILEKAFDRMQKLLAIEEPMD